MLNIKTISYKIKFLEEIVFKEEPEIAFFKAIYKRLKNILCINSEKDCKNCPHSSKCLYSYLSAKDFQCISSMPIIVHKPLFSNRGMKANDILDLKFTFLGDSIKHIDFIDFILKEFEARGLFREKHKFAIINRYIDQANILEDHGKINGIKILTPIDRKDNIFKAEREKLDNLNKLYNITDKSIDLIDRPYEFKAIKFKITNPLHIGSNKLVLEGYVGTVKFIEPITKSYLLDIINVIGAGEFYALGGGTIEFYKYDKENAINKVHPYT